METEAGVGVTEEEAGGARSFFALSHVEEEEVEAQVGPDVENGHGPVNKATSPFAARHVQQSMGPH
jgi:hypothetical protein